MIIYRKLKFLLINRLLIHKIGLVFIVCKSASYWAVAFHSPSSNYILPNPSFHAICRLRLGVAPFDDIKVCICGKSLIEDPLHFLTCNYLRRPIVSRHDRLTQTFR